MRLAITMLLQKDLHKSVAFYQDIGMKLLIYSKGQWAEFDAGGGVKLALCPADEEAVGGHSGLLFQVEDMNQLLTRLNEAGIEAPELTRIPLGKLVTLIDPSGNKFDVFEPSNEPQKGCCKEDQDLTQRCCSPSSCC